MHAKARLTVLGRRLLIQRVLQEGWPVARAAEAQGVSAATAYKWVRRFKAEGPAGLADRSSRPHHSPTRLSASREQAILACRAVCRVGPHRIAAQLGEARSTVHAVLRRAGMPRLADLDRPSGLPVRRYQHAQPGALVHVDVKKLGRIPDGGGHRAHGRATTTPRSNGRGWDYLHTMIDDRSRVAYVEVLADEQGATAAGFLARGLAWFADRGVRVQRVLTDNAWNWQARSAQAALGRARHLRTRAYRPQTNGKVERFHRTLTAEWAYARCYASNAARLDTLADWVHAYNHHRPHTALGGHSPMSILNNLPGNYT